LYEAPYNDDAQANPVWRPSINQLTEFFAADRRGDAAALFLK
jgi:hypothetical protein